MFKRYKNLRKKPYWGNHFWSRGYCVTTIGMDEEKIRHYVRYQEDKERLEEKECDEPLPLLKAEAAKPPPLQLIFTGT